MEKMQISLEIFNWNEIIQNLFKFHFCRRIFSYNQRLYALCRHMLDILFENLKPSITKLCKISLRMSHRIIRSPKMHKLTLFLKRLEDIVKMTNRHRKIWWAIWTELITGRVSDSDTPRGVQLESPGGGRMEEQ